MFNWRGGGGGGGGGGVQKDVRTIFGRGFSLSAGHD